eukprot:2099735-Rhodomonas_salina.1
MSATRDFPAAATPRRNVDGSAESQAVAVALGREQSEACREVGFELGENQILATTDCSTCRCRGR